MDKRESKNNKFSINRFTMYTILYFLILSLGPLFIDFTASTLKIDKRYIELVLVGSIILYSLVEYIKTRKMIYIVVLLLFVVLSGLTIRDLKVDPERYVTKDCSSYPNEKSQYFGVIQDIQTFGEDQKITVVRDDQEEKRYCRLVEDIQLIYTGKDIDVTSYYIKYGGTKPTESNISQHLVKGATITFMLDRYIYDEKAFKVESVHLLKPAEEFKK